MTKLEIGTGLAILTTVFVIGASWSTLNNRLDRLDEKLTAFEQGQADPLCLTVLSTQVKAIESGKFAKVKDDLTRLSSQFCPTPRPSTNIGLGGYEPASHATGVETPAERLARQQRANDELANIIAELEKPVIGQ